MLDELARFQDSVEIEQYFEDDKDSELPAKLKSIVSGFCELLVTLVEEETGEPDGSCDRNALLFFRPAAHLSLDLLCSIRSGFAMS